MNPKNKKVWPIIVDVCIHCKEVKDLVQRHKHRTNICEDCSRARQREYHKIEAEKSGRRAGIIGRLPYPLQGWSYIQQKHQSILKELKKCKSREEYRNKLRENLTNILENPELLKWINAHNGEERTNEVEAKRKAREGRKENIDTRNISWEEWNELGFGQEWDD